jgi:hypothetical protein
LIFVSKDPIDVEATSFFDDFDREQFVAWLAKKRQPGQSSVSTGRTLTDPSNSCCTSNTALSLEPLAYFQLTAENGYRQVIEFGRSSANSPNVLLNTTTRSVSTTNNNTSTTINTSTTNNNSTINNITNDLRHDPINWNDENSVGGNGSEKPQQVYGRYVLLKLLRSDWRMVTSSFDPGNIDLQYVGFAGHAGKQGFAHASMI